MNVNNESVRGAFGGDALLGKDSVWTPEVERFCQKIGRCMQLNLPGCHAYGVQRSGKSEALIFFAQSVAEFAGGPAFVTILDLENGLADRESSIIAEWLSQEQVASNANTPARLRKALHAYFLEQMALRHTKTIVLVVDEAQNCTRKHLAQILALGNRLTKLRYRVFTLLVGQVELRSYVESFQNMNEMQLVGRFFECEHEFLPIHPSEIDQVLRAFEADVACDDGSTQPPPVAAIFPDAWAKGWRPSVWGPALVEGLARFATSCGLPKDQRVGMQHLRSTFVAMLHRARSLDDPHTPMTPEVVVGYLEEIGLRNTWQRYAALGQKQA